MHAVVRFTRSARKHRIGKAHAVYVMEHHQPQTIPGDEQRDPQYVWIGDDDRGVELEIVAIDLPDMLLVIHVMPTAFRRK